MEKREARLLRREFYIRRTRHVCLWLGVLSLAGAIIVTTSGLFPPEQRPEVLIVLGAVCFLIAYTTHLQVRQIESIKARPR